MFLPFPYAPSFFISNDGSQLKHGAHRFSLADLDETAETIIANAADRWHCSPNVLYCRHCHGSGDIHRRIADIKDHLSKKYVGDLWYLRVVSDAFLFFDSGMIFSNRSTRLIGHTIAVQPSIILLLAL